jgi:hypothetical protein
MRDHYVIIERDAERFMRDAKVRIGDTMYHCDVHDDGEGRLFLHIDSSRPVRAQKQAPTGREAALKRADRAVHRMYGKR